MKKKKIAKNQHLLEANTFKNDEDEIDKESREEKKNNNTQLKLIHAIQFEHGKQKYFRKFRKRKTE